MWRAALQGPHPGLLASQSLQPWKELLYGAGVSEPVLLQTQQTQMQGQTHV